MSLSFLLFALISFGAGDSGTTTATWTVLSYATLSIAGGGGTVGSVIGSLSLPQPTAADLERGYLELGDALTLVAQSNVNWRLSIRTDDPDMGKSYDGTYTKPISDFQLGADGAYLTIAHEDQPLAEGGPGEHELKIDYRILFRQEYRPGNYHITLIYTIATE